MKARRRRLFLFTAAVAAAGGGTALLLGALGGSLIYFATPSQLLNAQDPSNDRQLRVGGLMEEDSLARAGGSVSFRVTDGAASLPVVFTGILPPLAVEGQGVVAEGRLDADGVLRASRILARHDESYIPREVVQSLKDSGRWRGDSAPRLTGR